MSKELELLRDASFEIKRLRKENELMNARLTMFDNMMTVFNTVPRADQRGMSPDILFGIDKHIHELSTLQTPNS